MVFVCFEVEAVRTRSLKSARLLPLYSFRFFILASRQKAMAVVVVLFFLPLVRVPSLSTSVAVLLSLFLVLSMFPLMDSLRRLLRTVLVLRGLRIAFQKAFAFVVFRPRCVLNRRLSLVCLVVCSLLAHNLFSVDVVVIDFTR